MARAGAEALYLVGTATSRESRVSVTTLVAASAALLMSTLDTTIVNIALPAIGRELGGGAAALQWIVDGYTLVFAAALLTGGALGDRLGMRRAFAIGLAVFGLASAACGLPPSIGLLIVARFVQGVGAALLVACSLALLRHAYEDQGARAKAISIWGAVGAAGVASGPVVGGLLIDAGGWRPIFEINVAAIALMLTAVGLTVRTVRGEPRERRPRAQLQRDRKMRAG